MNLTRLVACLSFCFLMLQLAGASAADTSLLQRASGGDPHSEDNVGYDYERGLAGYPVDMTQAAKWYRKAAEQGDAWGAWKLGLFYENGLGGLPKEASAAVRWYQVSAAHGSGGCGD